MLASLYPVRDMRLGGQVIHTGKSSMEIAVRMEALSKDGSEQTIMLGMIHLPLDHGNRLSPQLFRQVGSAWSAETRGHIVQPPLTHSSSRLPRTTRCSTWEKVPSFVFT